MYKEDTPCRPCKNTHFSCPCIMHWVVSLLAFPTPNPKVVTAAQAPVPPTQPPLICASHLWGYVQELKLEGAVAGVKPVIDCIPRSC